MLTSQTLSQSAGIGWRDEGPSEIFDVMRSQIHKLHPKAADYVLLNGPHWATSPVHLLWPSVTCFNSCNIHAVRERTLMKNIRQGETDPRKHLLQNANSKIRPAELHSRIAPYCTILVYTPPLFIPPQTPSSTIHHTLNTCLKTWNIMSTPKTRHTHQLTPNCVNCQTHSQEHRWEENHVTRRSAVFVHCPIRCIHTSHERDVMGGILANRRSYAALV